MAGLSNNEAPIALVIGSGSLSGVGSVDTAGRPKAESPTTPGTGGAGNSVSSPRNNESSEQSNLNTNNGPAAAAAADSPGSTSAHPNDDLATPMDATLTGLVDESAALVPTGPGVDPELIKVIKQGLRTIASTRAAVEAILATQMMLDNVNEDEWTGGDRDDAYVSEVRARAAEFGGPVIPAAKPPPRRNTRSSSSATKSRRADPPAAVPVPPVNPIPIRVASAAAAQAAASPASTAPAAAAVAAAAPKQEETTSPAVPPPFVPVVETKRAESKKDKKKKRKSKKPMSPVPAAAVLHVPLDDMPDPPLPLETPEQEELYRELCRKVSVGKNAPAEEIKPDGRRAGPWSDGEKRLVCAVLSTHFFDLDALSALITTRARGSVSDYVRRHFNGIFKRGRSAKSEARKRGDLDAYVAASQAIIDSAVAISAIAAGSGRAAGQEGGGAVGGAEEAADAGSSDAVPKESTPKAGEGGPAPSAVIDSAFPSATPDSTPPEPGPGNKANAIGAVNGAALGASLGEAKAAATSDGDGHGGNNDDNDQPFSSGVVIETPDGSGSGSDPAAPTAVAGGTVVVDSPVGAIALGPPIPGAATRPGDKRRAEQPDHASKKQKLA